MNSQMCHFRELPTAQIRLIHHQRIGWVITVIKTLNVQGLNYLGLTRSILYHGWWCPGSYCRIIVARTLAAMICMICRSLSYLSRWGRISTTCAISMWRNVIKYKYIFLFPLKNLACKGLKEKGNIYVTVLDHLSEEIKWNNIESFLEISCQD